MFDKYEESPMIKRSNLSSFINLKFSRIVFNDFNSAGIFSPS